MPRYIVHFNTNPSAWPSDPAQVLATWEAVMAGGSQLLEQGLFDEIGWVGNLEGYGLVEAESKASVIGLVNDSFPTSLRRSWNSPRTLRRGGATSREPRWQPRADPDRGGG